MIRLVRMMKLALLFGALALTGCNSLYFMPMKPWVQNPANQGLDYQDVILINGAGQRLHGWWLPARGDAAKAKGTVYFLHGNAQNVSTHIMNVAWLPAEGFNVFLLDYRGYGLSEGKARLPGAMEDIQLGLDWLRASGRLGKAPLIVFGQSLGASMTISVMADERNHGRYECLIAEAAFTGYRDIVGDIMRQSWLLSPLRFAVVPFQPRDFDAQDSIAAIRAPILLMHSQDDQVIPFAHGTELFEAASEPKQFQPLRGAHIASLRDPAVRQRMLDFMYQECGVRSVSATPEVKGDSPEPGVLPVLPRGPASNGVSRPAPGFTF